MMAGMPDLRMRSGGPGSSRGGLLLAERDRSPFGPNKRQRRFYDEYGYRGGDRNARGASPEPAAIMGRGRRSPPFYSGRAFGLDEPRGPGDHAVGASGSARGGSGDGRALGEDEREGPKGLMRMGGLSQGAAFEGDGQTPQVLPGGRGRRSFNDRQRDARRSRSRGSLDEGEAGERPNAGKASRGEPGGAEEEAGQLLMVCRVLKQGQRLCNMSAKFVRGDPNIRPPGVLDVNQRANLDRLQTHLRRGRHQSGAAPHGSGDGSIRYSIWQLGADTRQDSRQYDELCDYFINKERVGLLESPSQAIYMVPPNPKYIKPLDLPDANFMYAYVIAK